MQLSMRAAIAVTLLGLAACDELAVADDPVALANLRGEKSCVGAVARETGKTGVSVNTTIPVVELNRFIIDVPGGRSWTCVTDERGRALEIVERQNG